MFKQNYSLLFVLATLTTTLQQIVYPSTTQRLQWKFSGQWLNCESKMPILPQQCSNGIEELLECYLIPLEGLCTKEFTSTTDLLYLSMELHPTADTLIEMAINGNNVPTLSNSYRQGLTISNVKTTTPNIISIKTPGNLAVYLVFARLQTAKQPPNCEQEDDLTFLCQNCNSDYMRYYTSCYSNDCSLESTQISEQGITPSIKLEEESINVDFQLKLGTLGKCLQFFLFLSSNFDDLTPTYFFDQDKISDQGDGLIRLATDIEQLSQIPCDQLETSEAYVKQCYIHLAVVLERKIQYHYLQQIKVFINKKISADFTTESADGDLESPEGISIQVLSEAKIFSISIEQDSYRIIAKQTILDPYYLKYTPKVTEASIYVNEKKVPLVLEQTKVSGNEVTYTLRLSLQNGEQINESTSLQLIATMEQTSKNRFLQRSSFFYYLKNMIIIDKELFPIQQDTSKVKKDSSIAKKKNKNIQFPLLIIIIPPAIIIIFILIWRQVKKHNERQDKKQQTVNQDPEVDCLQNMEKKCAKLQFYVGSPENVSQIENHQKEQIIRQGTSEIPS